MYRKKFFLLMAIFSAIVPWTIFGLYLLQNQFNMAVFFDNGAVASVFIELVAINFVFIIWSYFDAAKHKIWKWWLLSICSYVAGCAVPMPLYIFFRMHILGKRRALKLVELSESSEAI